eukprot:2033922-Pleurochrysis_carterae.AAC.1
MRNSQGEDSSAWKSVFPLDSSSMIPRTPRPPLCCVVELFSSATRDVNSDGGCPPVGTPCARPS